MPDIILEKKPKPESGALSLPTEKTKLPENKPKPIENEPIQLETYEDFKN